MDRQDKKSKSWYLFGDPEDRAIASAKYKREMGINPSYKTEQNAEVSRSARSMKNPTDRPYDVKASPKGLKKVEPPSDSVRRGPNRGLSQSKKVETAPPPSSPPKPRVKPEVPKAGSVPEKAATDKSRVAPKMTNYQRMRAKQLEKEGYAGRSLTRAQAQKMAGAKSASNTSSLMSLFGISKKKTETPKATTKRTGPLKSAFAQISYQGRKK